MNLHLRLLEQTTFTILWNRNRGSLNKFHGQHALQERARKLDQGILIIRLLKETSENMILLKDIVPAAQNNIDTKFIILDKGKTTVEGQNKICLALVADATAAIHFQFWGDECDAFDSGYRILLSVWYKRNLGGGDGVIVQGMKSL
ncbi:Coiled-coil domain-containing protein 130 [Glycine soja]